jgi:3-oxoadipate enol-lactonase
MTQVVALRDGALLAYDSSDFTDPWTKPSSVVLVHGFSKNRMFWNAWMPALARYHRVIRVDLRGHGQSSLPPENAELTLSTFVDDLIELLDQVGLHSAHFVMAEFASSIAIELGSAIPYRTKSLTMPGFGFDWRDAPIDWPEWSRVAREEGALAWAEQTSHYRMHRDTIRSCGNGMLSSKVGCPAGYWPRCSTCARGLICRTAYRS